MYFEGENLRGFIVYVAQRHIDCGDFIGVHRVAKKIAVGFSVIPTVFGDKIIFVDEATFDFEIFMRAFFYIVIASGRPIPVHFGCITRRSRGDVASLASD